MKLVNMELCYVWEFPCSIGPNLYKTEVPVDVY